MTTIDHAPSRRTRAAAIARTRPIAAWQIAMGTLLALLVAFGITTSSLGVDVLRDDPASSPPGVLAGGPDSIRSDEYLRTTPWALGVAARGDDSFGTPLALDDFALATRGTGGPVTTVLFPETQLLRLGGTALRAQTFALAWWLPTFLVLVLLPVWFRQLRAPAAIGIPLTVVIVASPVSVWWSWGVLNVLGWAVAAAVCAVAACESQRAVGLRSARTIALAAAGAWSAARLGLSYQPWAIPLAVGTLSPSLAAVLARPARRLRVAALAGSIAVAGGALLLAFLAEHRRALEVIGQTVYPGTRRFAGELLEIGHMLAAPHLWFLQTNPVLVGTNTSEVTTAPLVLGLVALVLVAAIDWSSRAFERAATTTALAACGVLGSWCLVAWPDWAERLFPANVVSPLRVVQVLGIPATLAFGLVLHAWRVAPNGQRRAVAAVTTACALGATLVAGSALRQGKLPTYPTEWIVLTSLVLGVLVLGAIASRSSWSLVPLAVVALLATAAVNPLQQGGGDLVDGRAARQVRAHGSERDVWASDATSIDALLMANGRTSLSGQLWVGPDDEAWERLDPDGDARGAWNRAASYAAFAWDPGAREVAITAPAPDVVQVQVDPCSPSLDAFDLRWVVANRELDSSCLRRRASFEFGGERRFVYERST